MVKILYVVIPCYNEEPVISETVRQLTEKLNDLIIHDMISIESRIMLVNDGSKDKTWDIIQTLFKSNTFVVGLNLSRNRGHQNALLAGLLEARKYSDMVISMDADLQDSISVLSDFVQKYYEGYDVVYGVRRSRDTDTIFKRSTATMFYRFMEKMGVEIVYNHADYRLLSKRAINSLSDYKEVNLFLRGLIPLIGYKSTIVQYDRNERFAGESKYPLSKMIAFAIDGITSCSIKPIRIISSMGLLFSLLSLVYLIYVIVSTLLNHQSVEGWATIIVLISLFGSLQIFCIGIIGEYIGKIYNEVKHRPRYIIQDYLLK